MAKIADKRGTAQRGHDVGKFSRIADQVPVAFNYEVEKGDRHVSYAQWRLLKLEP